MDGARPPRFGADVLILESTYGGRLHANRHVEEQRLVETVTATDSVAFFAEALTLTRRRPDLAPLVERTLERLRAEGVRAYAGQIERHGWRSLRDPDASSRRFWALAVGVIVEGHAIGRSPEELAAEMLRVLGDQATTNSTNDKLRLVGSEEASSTGSEP